MLYCGVRGAVSMKRAKSTAETQERWRGRQETGGDVGQRGQNVGLFYVTQCWRRYMEVYIREGEYLCVCLFWGIGLETSEPSYINT